jgi:4-hydroxy-4-methyl-2-oxoglutarate aldolase
LPAVRASGIQMFAGSVAVSHAYAHIFDVGAQIVIGEMEVRPAELLYGDPHGVLSIPLEIAGQVPEVAAELQERERKVVEFCRSSAFSVTKLGEVIKTMP